MVIYVLKVKNKFIIPQGETNKSSLVCLQVCKIDFQNIIWKKNILLHFTIIILIFLIYILGKYFIHYDDYL